MSPGDRSAREAVAHHVDCLLRGSAEDRGRGANEILSLVQRGGSIEALRPLFEASNLECTKTLTFILSELGTRAAEAMDWLLNLLDFPDEWVRFYAVVAVQNSGSLVHGQVTARAISMIENPGPESLAAMRLISMGSLPQIATAVPFLEEDLGGPVGWLVREKLDEWERFSRRGGLEALVAVAAAYRLRELGDSGPLDTLVEDGRKPVREAARFVARFRPLPLAGHDILHRIDRDSTGD